MKKAFRVDSGLEMRLTSMRFKDELVSLVDQNIYHLNQWMPWATNPYRPDATIEHIAKVEKNFKENKELPLMIFAGDKPVGTINLFDIDPVNMSGEIGYWLAEKAQGKGIITRCCRVIVDYGFSELNLNRIVILCATENNKSRAIPEKLGFSIEGELRQSRRLHDEFVGLVVYSKLKEEWEKSDRSELPVSS
ncbi:MAG: GNAT family N-acetyltransferase [Pyrinomonadaceae bacterium]|nr:GNAT family N-acetyltransferase [Pyrinomonadaceae bacterium]